MSFLVRFVPIRLSLYKVESVSEWGGEERKLRPRMSKEERSCPVFRRGGAERLPARRVPEAIIIGTCPGLTKKYGKERAIRPTRPWSGTICK